MWASVVSASASTVAATTPSITGRDGQAGGHYEQRQVHRLYEGGFGEIGQQRALRAHLVGDGDGVSQGAEGLLAHLLCEVGGSGGEHVLQCREAPRCAPCTNASPSSTRRRSTSSSMALRPPPNSNWIAQWRSRY